MMPRFDRDDVLAGLHAEDVLAHYGVRHHRAGRWLRSNECPSCGTRSSDAFAVSNGTDTRPAGFRCHRCEVRGDLLGLVALFESLDLRRDFERVLALGADIAGVPPRDQPLSTEERQRRARDRQALRDRQRQQLEVEEQERRERCIAPATETWEHLRRRSGLGERYLVERGLAELVGRSDLLRFDDRCNIRVPLHDSSGRIVNVVVRYLPDRLPRRNLRVQGMTGHPTLGTFGSLADLGATAGSVVIVEGVFDYLSGLLVFPGQLVLGAHGAGNLSAIAEGVAAHARDRGLVLVPHLGDRTRAGEEQARRAARVAADAGLARDRIGGWDVTPHGDLNDWWRAQRAIDSPRCAS